MVVQYYANVPSSIRKLHCHVSIAVEIIYVKSLTFLVMVFKSLKYMALVYINIRKKTQLISGLTKGRQLYAKYYFLVNFINIENEFETLRDNFPRVDFNITGADKHVPEAEWQIRVFKKRTWSVQHTLPFRKI